MRATRLLLTTLTAAALCVPGASGYAQVKVTTSSGDVLMLSQKNVVDHMIIGDSLEIEAAQLAALRTQNAAVKDFANMLVTDGRSHLDNLRKLAGKHDIGREANPADTAGASLTRRVTDLRSMAADSGFDRTFVQDQIWHHTREIADLKILRQAATDDDLQKDIDKTVPILERHLSRAKEVAAQLGIPSDGT